MVGTLLCVDADADARAATAERLREATDGEVIECPDLATATGALDATVDCVVSEFELPDGTGLDLLAELRETVPDAGFVLFTVADPDEVDTSTLRGGVAEYVPKGSPNAHDMLVELVRHTVAFRTQTAYPLPDDEARRVDALAAYRPVLAAAEPAFDRLATLASDLLDVPMAAIGVIDDRTQEFVACYGVDFGVFPREDTVCTYAALEPGVTTIPDLADDPRFAGNEGLAEHDLRAYASANLTSPEGRVVGTFCVYDSGPREWTDEDRERLRLLAAEAMETLELRRRLHGHGLDASTRDPDNESPNPEQVAPTAGSPPAGDSTAAERNETENRDGGER